MGPAVDPVTQFAHLRPDTADFLVGAILLGGFPILGGFRRATRVCLSLALRRNRLRRVGLNVLRHGWIGRIARLRVAGRMVPRRPLRPIRLRLGLGHHRILGIGLMRGMAGRHRICTRIGLPRLRHI